MPVCYVTVSEKLNTLGDEDVQFIRKAVAKGLDSKARRLDENHIAIRVLTGSRRAMLGDIEVEIFAQLYLRRLFSRDKRSNVIAKMIASHFECGCATWINLCMVGYSRSTCEGDYYSDSDNRLVRFLQKKRGVSTRTYASTSDSGKGIDKDV